MNEEDGIKNVKTHLIPMPKVKLTYHQLVKVRAHSIPYTKIAKEKKTLKKTHAARALLPSRFVPLNGS